MSPELPILIKKFLLEENEDIDRELAALSLRTADYERKKAANLNIIAGIEQREQLDLPNAKETKAAIVEAIAIPNRAVIVSHPPSPGKYGALRKRIRAVCHSMTRFNLDDIAGKCPEIDRATLANNLWNLEKIGDLRIVEKIGEGRKATRVYENVHNQEAA